MKKEYIRFKDYTLNITLGGLLRWFAFVIVIMAISLSAPRLSTTRSNASLPPAALVAARSCDPYKVVVSGASLEPLVADGQTLMLIPGECIAPSRGDLVSFTTTAELAAPVLKRIAAAPGDHLEVRSDGAVLVNGIPALAPDGSDYIATVQGRHMMTLYAGTVPPHAYLVLGSPGSLDSGRIGLIAGSAIRGVAQWPAR